MIKPLHLLPLLLCSCTMLDVNKGTYFTGANNTLVRIDAANGKITHYEAATNNHSTPIRAYGSVLGTGLSGAALLMGGSGMGAIVK